MSHPTPKISVVICTYNRCNALKGTLLSLEQMFVPESLWWELLVVDNNSNDKTRETVETFAAGSRVNTKYIFEPTLGLSHARNRGVSESRGDVVSFIDDDVVVAPNWLGEIWKAFEKYDALCVGGRVLLQGNPQMPLWWDKSFDIAVGKFDRGESVILERSDAEGLIGIGANMSFRRAVFDKYGLFDTGMGRIGTNGHRTGEETDLVNRMRENKELTVYYPSALVYHCIPIERLSKRYLRRNAFHFGTWYRRSGSVALSKQWQLLGMPLWMYRSGLGAAGMMVALNLVGRRAAAFVQERRLLTYVGYFVAARRADRSQPGWSQCGKVSSLR